MENYKYHFDIKPLNQFLNITGTHTTGNQHMNYVVGRKDLLMLDESIFGTYNNIHRVNKITLLLLEYYSLDSYTHNYTDIQYINTLNRYHQIALRGLATALNQNEAYQTLYNEIELLKGDSSTLIKTLVNSKIKNAVDTLNSDFKIATGANIDTTDLISKFLTEQHKNTGSNIKDETDNINENENVTQTSKIPKLKAYIDLLQNDTNMANAWENYFKVFKPLIVSKHENI